MAEQDGKDAAGFDPYRFGAPAPVGASTPTGKQILLASWRMLRRDRSLLVLPILGTVFGLAAFAVVFVPGLIVVGFGVNGHRHFATYVFAAIGGLLASIVGVYFQAALVAGVYQRADGIAPTVGSCLSAAWRLRRQVLAWAVLAATVGAVVRAVEQRLGVFGRVLGFLGGVAWAVATFFVVPVVVAEGIGPVEALKRSARTVREIWGTGVRTTLRLGLLAVALMLAPIAVMVFGIGLMIAFGTTAAVSVGVAVFAIGFVALFALAIVLGAMSTYARALIYRWTTGRPVPGIDPALFAGAFAARRRRFGR